MARPPVAIPGHVALVGLPGVGKSSIGWRAADLLECSFVDLDVAIVERDGRPIPEIFADDGDVGVKLTAGKASEGSTTDDVRLCIPK